MSTITRTTRLIQVETGLYPLFLNSLTELVPNAQFPSKMEAEDLLEWGFEEVLDVEIPVDDVVSEGKPELRDGSWYRTWLARSFTAGELAANLSTKKAQLLDEAEILRAAQFEQGFPHVFGENTYHVQIRDQDRPNITALRVIAKEAVDEAREMTFYFRVYENVVVPLTAAETVAMANAAFAAANASYANVWAFKDAVTAATSIAELPVFPTDLFTL